MAKIIFIQREAEDRLGAMILSSYLKSNGQDSEIVIDPYKNIKHIINKTPDFIGLSVFSPSVDWTLDACRFIKMHLPNVLTILGGPHPTFFSNIIENENVDMVCIGEGEKALLELMRSYNGSIYSIETTPNFWIKRGDNIIKNKILPLLTKEELSELPFSDRSHYKDNPTLRKTPHKRMWTSRGCPYSCNYCFNARYKEIYSGKGKMVRQRSVDSVIKEMEEIKKIGVKVFDIVDDQFLMSKQWIHEFSEKYRKYVGVPFVCNTTANKLNHDTALELKKAGCRSVNFAIESGVERIRKEVYNKPISNNDIYNAADALNSIDMPFLTYNMIGLPEESLEDIYQTIRINQEIKATYPQSSILQPYPGTKIVEFIKDCEGTLPKKFTYSFYQASVIGDGKRQQLISNAHKLFTYLVKTNSGFDKFVRLVKCQSIKSYLYYIPFYWLFGKGVRRRYEHSWFSLFRYWLYTR